jgi:hypothetical protein
MCMLQAGLGPNVHIGIEFYKDILPLIWHQYSAHSGIVFTYFPPRVTKAAKAHPQDGKCNEAPLLLIVNLCSVPRTTACLVGCVVHWWSTPHYLQYTGTYFWAALCECVELFICLSLVLTWNCVGFYKINSVPSGPYLSCRTPPVVNVCHFIITKPAWMIVTYILLCVSSHCSGITSSSFSFGVE